MTTAFDNLSPDRLSHGIYWQRSWNIVLGCSPVSPGCANCWSAREAKRFAAHPNTRICSRYAGLTKAGRWTGLVRCNMSALDLPREITKPTVFALWTDLFHEDVPDGFRDQVFARMALEPQHVFLVLTKRPEKMLEYLTDASTTRAAVRGEILRWINPYEPLECIPWPLPNVFVGATAEDQQRLDERAPHLVDLAGLGWRTWLSLEPLLGPVTFRWRQAWRGADGKKTALRPDRAETDHLDILRRCSWIVAGGETGPGARPMYPDWIRTVRDECVEAEVPFLFKQWGEWLPDNQNSKMAGIGEHDRGSIRVGKKRAGRHIDGQIWDSLPNL